MKKHTTLNMEEAAHYKTVFLKCLFEAKKKKPKFPTGRKKKKKERLDSPEYLTINTDDLLFETKASLGMYVGVFGSL